MIEFKSVSKTYPDGTKAVTELDLVVPSDQITVLVGPSGCGKTTTLRMINRMIEPTSGTIEWDGKPIKQLRKTALRRQMGYALQQGGLFPHRTVAENIGTVPGLLRWSDAKIADRVQEMLELVGLDASLANRFPAQLSGGQKQRVGVARALAADPVLLLMDEPFSAVDPVIRADLQKLVKRLQQELKKTIVLITHDIDEAITMGDQVAVLRPGGVLAQFATPAEVLDHPADDFVREFVGRDRGYRSLTFADELELPLSRVRTVRNAPAAYGPRDDKTVPVLVLDAQAHPLGWADAQQSGRVLALGTVFDHRRASLREVLEASLISPVGLAVAVDGDGRFAGVVSGADVMDQARRYRGAIAVAAAGRSERDEDAAAVDESKDSAEREVTTGGASDAETAQTADTVQTAGADAAESDVSVEDAATAEPAGSAQEAEPAEPAEPTETTVPAAMTAIPTEDESAELPASVAEPASAVEPEREPASAPEPASAVEPECEPASAPEPASAAEPEREPASAAEPASAVEPEQSADSTPAPDTVPTVEELAAAKAAFRDAQRRRVEEMARFRGERGRKRRRGRKQANVTGVQSARSTAPEPDPEPVLPASPAPAAEPTPSLKPVELADLDAANEAELRHQQSAQDAERDS